MVRFTKHAFQRSYERLSLRHEGVAAIIERNLWINVGEEEDSSIIHCLFLSPYDGRCFVAIFDPNAQMVITILPLEYHENLAWKIPDESILEARKFKPQIHSLLNVVYTKVVPNEGKVSSTFKIKILKTLSNGERTYMYLGSISANQFNGEVKELVEDPLFSVELLNRLETRGISL